MRPSWTFPRVLAHRGGGALAPENTLAGLRTAASMGFGAVEFDVMLSSDGVAVLMHDETLDRTTDGSGLVSGKTYAEMLRLDAGVRFGPGHSGERIPSFEQAARLCVELKLWANVEIKPAKGHERETGVVAAKLARELWRGAAPAPLLSSFEPLALEAAREVAPELNRGYLTDHVEPEWRGAAERLGCVSVNCNHEYLSRELARMIVDAGYWLLCWTVNDPRIAHRLFDWGVDAIFTDRLDLIGPDFS